MAFPGYWLWDVMVALIAVLFGVLVAGALAALMFPASLRRWLRWPSGGEDTLDSPKR